MNKRVIIEISPTRVELGLARGRQVSVIRTQALAPDPDVPWNRWLEAVGGRLREWGEKTGLGACRATVLVTGGEGLATVMSSAASISGAARRSAALLALADRVTFPLEGQPADVQVMVRDPGSAAGGNEGEAPQVHLLAAADTDDSLTAVTGAISAAGFRPASVLPAAAPEIMRAVNLAIERSRKCGERRADGSAMVLRFGEHASVLAAAEGGRLRFVRTVSIGAEMLVAAIAPLLGEGGVKAAREAMYLAGIPAPDDAVDAAGRVTGRALLPLLQPILQRCVVEVKQSLRFGLSRRDDVRLIVDGFGARIPRLGEVLADAVGVSVEQPPPSCSGVPASSDCGAIAALAESPSLTVSLLPNRLADRRASRRIQLMTAVGAMAAATYVGADGVLAHLAAARLEGQVAVLEQRSATDAELHEKQAAAVRQISATYEAQRRLNSALGQSPDWAATLAFIAGATPEQIRLDRVEVVEEEAGPLCRLSGRVKLRQRASGAAEIRRYVDLLAAAPIARKVHLGATGRVESDRGAEQHFELTVELVPLPASHHYSQIVAATEIEP